MSKRDKYPRIHNERKKGPGASCEPCEELGLETGATHDVCMEFTYMRGEDEFTRVCEIHLNEIRQLVHPEKRSRHWPLWFQGIWK